MKKLLMLLYFNITFIITVLSQAGSLDPSFGNNGYIESESPNLHQMGYNSIAVQSDGRILVIKQVGQYGWFDFAMNRYNPNGTLDVDFGTDGTVVTDFGNSLDFPFDIVIQPDGKIIVVGFSNAPNIDASSIAMCRYNTDGALDVNFGVNGIVTTTPGSLVLLATSVALQSDGKIVVVGAVSSVGVDFGISRYNTNGTLDASFGINGSMITDLGTYRYDYPTSIAIQADGKIVVAGYTYYVNITSAEDYNLAVCRYNSDGTLDANFGQDGLVIRDPELDMYFNSTPIAIQNDGKIIIAMTTFVNFTVHSDFALCRYNIDGSPDPNFGEGGLVTTDFGNWETLTSLAIQSDGKIVAAGNTIGNTIGSNHNFAISRYNTDGSMDIEFGEDGKVISDLGTYESINSIILNANRIYAAGWGQFPNLAIVAAYSLINICSGNPGLEITIPDTYAINPGGNINTVYIGYQPASSITLTATPSGGNAPYNYNWSTAPSQNTQQITMSPTIAGTYNYNVTVTDASGCTAQFSKTITAVNIISGQNLDKAYICHRDLKGKWSTLSVLAGSVANHLAHGDYLGICNNNSSNSEILTRVANEIGGQKIIQKGFKIYPNPATHFLDVLWTTKNISQSTIRILNAEGKTVKTLTTQGAVNKQRISLNGLTKGVYMLILKTGSEQQVSKFVIQ